MIKKRTIISKKTKKKFVDLRFAKAKGYRGGYRKVLEIIKKTGKCPFCKENFEYHKKTIFKTNKKWFIVESTWPYRNAKFHFLIIPEKHKENLNELNSSDFKSVCELANWALKKYKIKGGGLALRFGESSYTGATVFHLHFHLIVPEINKKTKRAKVVSFPIG